MKITVKAKPSARQASVEKIDDTHFVVAVTEPPVEGRANAAIVKALAAHFSTAPSNIRLISGATWKQKVFEIDSLKLGE